MYMYIYICIYIYDLSQVLVYINQHHDIMTSERVGEKKLPHPEILARVGDQPTSLVSEK